MPKRWLPYWIRFKDKDGKIINEELIYAETYGEARIVGLERFLQLKDYMNYSSFDVWW